MLGLQLQAAGPITHAFLTELFFKQFPKYDSEEQKAFRLGTLFPDVRYLGTISREETHFPEMSLEEVVEETNPFLAGMKFHSYVDIAREDFIVSGGYYKLISHLPIEHLDFFLKLIEDEILFSSLEKKAWKQCLKKVVPEELLWNVEEKTVKKWHAILDYFFSYFPSTLAHYAYLNGKGYQDFSSEEVKHWDQNVKPMAHDEKVNHYLAKSQSLPSWSHNLF
ncbi:MAG: hypothetical protein ACE5GN_06870, partial [Waddliaceae bacterium]